MKGGYGSVQDLDMTAFTFSATVTPKFAHASGLVFHDKNHNGRVDSGESLAWARVSFLHTAFPNLDLVTTTNANGDFSFPKLPTGKYVASAQAQGLAIPARTVTVDESGVDGIELWGAQPVTGLSAKVAFSKDRYAKARSSTAGAPDGAISTP